MDEIGYNLDVKLVKQKARTVFVFCITICQRIPEASV